MTLTAGRVLLIVAAILFLIAGIFVLVHTGADLVEPLALFGFSAWSGSGAV